MYEGHFNLRGRPFLAAPDVARYFPAIATELARETLLRAIARGEGPALVIGAPGTGKSLLCQMIAEEFAARFAVALLVNGRFGSREALLQAILHQLGIPYRGLEEGELRLALFDCLDPAASDHQGLLLIVDEAHLLPWRVLEEIRLLTNLVRNSQPRVRVVMAGGTVLEERFGSPKLSSFSQRLAARCYLGPMDATETAAYIRAQIAAVDGHADQLFDEAALRAVHRVSDGVARVVNQVCDHALILACVAEIQQLNEAAIEEAWGDLQQLPTPSAQCAGASSDHVVEFGGLDEPGDEGLTAIPFPTAAPRQRPFGSAAEDLDAIGPSSLDADLDSAFRPAGSIGTEVDLDSGAFGDPFSEHFDQEEVVLDRFGAQAELFYTRPRTTSAEGRELGEMLESWAARQHRGAPASLRLGPLAVPLGLIDEPAPRDGIQRGMHAGHSKPMAVKIDDSPVPSEPMSPEAASNELAAGVDPPSWRQSFSQGQLMQVSLVRGSSKLLSDCQIVVLEDEKAQSIIVDRPTSPPAPLGRKREFRHLFAKLRRD
jgi:type II secretory pathway predicted ATPase ExeA